MEDYFVDAYARVVQIYVYIQMTWIFICIYLYFNYEIFIYMESGKKTGGAMESPPVCNGCNQACYNAIVSDHPRDGAPNVENGCAYH